MEWSAKNPDKFNSNLKKYRSTDKYKDGFKSWKTANKERIALYDKNKKAKRKTSKGHSAITKSQWDQIVLKANNKCYWCGEKMKSPTMDHYVPLSRGGLHSIDNIVPSCLSCNCKKQHKDPYKYAQSIGRLF